MACRLDVTTPLAHPDAIRFLRMAPISPINDIQNREMSFIEKKCRLDWSKNVVYTSCKRR
jgi:hypothetical protein